MIKKSLSIINARLQRVEDTFLPLLFILTLLLAVTQIILRNFFNFGFSWAEPLLRMMVLWLGMFGALYATRMNRHINIDVINHYLQPSTKHLIQRAVHLFSAIVCLICCYFSIPFLLMEYKDGAIAFANVPAWLAEGIIPLALFIMGMRFLSFALARQP